MKLRFDECVLDLHARQLERQRKVVAVEPKVYELLEVLIRRRPAVVPNSELDELLWPRAYVARTSLTRLVSKLRTALGDTPDNPRIIRTAYKVGYSFCAEVSSVEPVLASVASVELVWRKQAVPLAEGEHYAGRDEGCAVVVDADTVSRKHARIVVLSGTVTIEDLASTNGTRINGTRIHGPTRLAPGDTLSLGSETLQLKKRNASALTVKLDNLSTIKPQKT